MSDPEGLDDLFDPRRSPTDLQSAQIHPRLLEFPLGDNQVRWVLASFAPGDDVAAFHEALRARLEAALLAELSRSSASLDAGAPTVERIDLVAFGDAPDLAPAVRAFAMVATEERDREVLARLRHEATLVDLPAPDAPASVWTVPVSNHVDPTLYEAIASRTGDELFGEEPGAFFARLAGAIGQRDGTTPPPNPSGLDQVEAALVSKATGVIRFIPSLCFQGLCDMVGVLLDAMGRRPAWAVSEEEDEGVFAPPLLRIQSGRSEVHLPIGLELLRWCVMPLQKGESVPSLSEWVQGSFR
ncbi:MAG: hypothetical protein AAGF12_30100 [Myxococcota bacterium]